MSGSKTLNPHQSLLLRIRRIGFADALQIGSFWSPEALLPGAGEACVLSKGVLLFGCGGTFNLLERSGSTVIKDHAQDH